MGTDFIIVSKVILISRGNSRIPFIVWLLSSLHSRWFCSCSAALWQQLPFSGAEDTCARKHRLDIKMGLVLKNNSAPIYPLDKLHDLGK